MQNGTILASGATHVINLASALQGHAASGGSLIAGLILALCGAVLGYRRSRNRHAMWAAVMFFGVIIVYFVFSVIPASGS